VSGLSDAAVRHLRDTVDRPDASPRYEVLELLGRGGMGAVYRAHDRTLQRDVALKVLALPADTGPLASRLAREAQVLARLEHPGIVAVHDAGTLDDGRPYYVMRLVRGRSLGDYRRGVGVGELLRLFLRLCDAVAFAHARGVIHRDLKPSNVMVGEYGEVLVLDWGVAKVMAGDFPGESGDDAPPRAVAERAGAASGDVTQDGTVVGTPGFMAPEQATGGSRDADARADVFGLGAILRDLLAVEGGGARCVVAPLGAIVARATAPAPADRYPDVDALSADVRRWLDGERVAAHREGMVERAVRVYRRNRPIILLLVAYAVVRVTILLWRGV